MQTYPLGTREYVVVDVTDRLSNLASLDSYQLLYNVVEKTTGTSKYTDAAAGNNGMMIQCLIDTTGWNVGVYQLWTTIVADPESPKLGPFEFRVVN